MKCNRKILRLDLSENMLRILKNVKFKKD